MKTLTITRAEMDKMTPTYGAMPDGSLPDWIRQRLLAAGFTMTEIIYRDGVNGNCVYAQKEHETEDIETAFGAY